MENIWKQKITKQHPTQAKISAEEDILTSAGEEETPSAAKKDKPSAMDEEDLPTDEEEIFSADEDDMSSSIIDEDDLAEDNVFSSTDEEEPLLPAEEAMTSAEDSPTDGEDSPTGQIIVSERKSAFNWRQASWRDRAKRSEEFLVNA